MGKKKPVEVERWSFDTEDDSKGNVLWIDFFNGYDHHSFDRRERAVEWLLDQEGDFWAVNLEYDMVNVFGPLLENMCVLTYGGFGLLKATIYGKPVKFYNTLRHWPLSVEEMGDRLGYPKLPFDPTNLEYCRRDCEITWRFVEEMLKRYSELGMESVGATLPSTALKYFTHKFCQVNYFRHESIQVWKRLARSRYGGRCEVFHTHPVETAVHEYDINSSYPHAMLSNEFPNLDTVNTSPSKPDFSLAGVACCTVKAPALEFPILPWKGPEGKKLLFPYGTFTGCWTYPEIRAALAAGYTIERVHDAIEYKLMASPFAEYITFLYNERMRVKDTDPLMAYTLKIAMNSTFGKFGEEGELQVISRGVRHTMNQVPKHSNMIWASYILAYGRLALYKYISQASEKGTVLYCDTDSVFVKCKEKPFGDGSKELGQLSFKGTHWYAHFKLPKLYRVDDSYKAKGVPLDKRSEDMERLKREFFYEGVAEFLKPYRFMEARKLKEIPNLWRETSKQLNAEYDKREMIGNGRTFPHKIEQNILAKPPTTGLNKGVRKRRSRKGVLHGG